VIFSFVSLHLLTFIYFMKHFFCRSILSLLILTAISVTVSAQMPSSWEEPLPSGPVKDDYEPGPDSKRQEGVPVGKVFNIPFENSKVFPGTIRNISVYVPSQYKAEKPACVYVGLDGLGFNVPVVFDNLIHKGELPIIIAIGVSPGNVPPAEGKDNPRFNRCYEFDGLSDQLCRMLIEEIFPLVENTKPPDGLEIKLSKDPNDRCTGGGSTGGIGAFKLAWERPDQFRRVFSAIGTFVCMRGGDRYPVLVRKSEPKPLRIFLQDGHHDQWGGGPEVGDWWIGNVALNRALEFSGYDVNHAWGTGPHSGKQANAIFPDVMRWLWRDYPQPIKAAPEKSLNVFLKQILKPEEDWQETNENVTEILKPALANESGVPLPNGDRYLSDTKNGTVSLVKQNGDKIVVAENLVAPSGVAPTPDGKWLAVIESQTHCGTSYRIKTDGTLEYGQRYYWFHVPDDAENLGSGICQFDQDGRIYVATRMGVQVLDRSGRSRAILPLPNTDGHPEALSLGFGGADLDTIYVTNGKTTYKRKLNIKGAPTWKKFDKLPNWGAG
jgi:enterochelin esterase-like enzyme